MEAAKGHRGKPQGEKRKERTFACMACERWETL